jgi:uncharacterized protein YfdQ (DUF2303 family)
VSAEGWRERPEAEVIAEVAREGVAETYPIDPEILHAALLPYPGARVEILDLEKHRARPTRARGTYRPATVKALIDYVGAHYDEAATTVWVDREGPAVRVILDDHAGSPGWRDHQAVLTLERTPEWQHWRRHDGTMLPQQQFAEHLEDGIREIVLPDAATMLEVAQSIQGTTGVEFKAGQRLQSGEVALQYVETTDARAGRKGDLEIPAEFTLEVAPFYGEAAQPVNARLRYRIAQGGVQLGYRLERPVEVELTALRGIADRLAEPFARVYMGRPAE